MEAVTDELLAHRLEGAWPLLDAARVQYRAVVLALRAWGWRARLRRVVDVAREVARRDDEVARHLERALRRAEAEGWPVGRVTETLAELASHRAALIDLLEATPSAGLRELLRKELLAPRVVPAAERAAVASLALRLEPGLLEALESFGRELERLFSRPVVLSRADYEVIVSSWPRGAHALGRAWRELEQVDLGGALVRELRARAAHAPRAGAGPVDELLRAAFWKATAEARMRDLLATWFGPARVQPSEAVAAMRYLLARREGCAETLEGPRGALLMLAHELSTGGRAPLAGGRATLRAWAAAADQRRDDPDWERVRASLGASSVQRLMAGPLAAPRAPACLAELFAAGDEP